ncbi:MAG: cardiolipin synthase B [Bryobacterales bacterium]|nr:cardiolipin synthase B [Bryobacterales bacterium]
MNEPRVPTQTPPRRRKRPPQWRHINFPTRGISRLHPAPPRPVRQQARDVWDRVRLLIRSATLWLLFSAVLLYHRWYITAAIAFAVSFTFVVFRPYIREVRMHADEDFGTDSAEFLSTVAGATGVPMIGGNRLEILNNGEEFYPAMLAAISRAKYSITMEQYIFSASEIGRQFAEAFAKRSLDGVNVKLLLDAVGAANIGSEILRTLTGAGCEIRWYRPIRWYDLHRVNHRNHRKSLIIDGRIAFTGGAGIDDHWRGAARNPSEWRDLQIRMEGPGVVPLQTGFASNWLEATGEVVTGPEYYPVPEPVGPVELQTVLSSPKGDQYTASILYALGIQSARQCIYIANPYFVPGPLAAGRIEDAVRRGVDVKVMVAGSHNDAWWARQNSVRLYGRLLEAGVEIYEYLPTMLHQKMMLVDSIWATVGTTNFDNRSFRFNEETNVCFHEPEYVDQLRTIFFKDLEECRRVDLAEWRGRGVHVRAGELFASLLQDQV